MNFDKVTELAKIMPKTFRAGHFQTALVQKIIGVVTRIDIRYRHLKNDRRRLGLCYKINFRFSTNDAFP